MSIKILPPTSDFVFKLLFGDERNKSALIGLGRARGTNISSEWSACA